ncbi:MAG: metalloregulator ArsR/SmtB family transcription factor [Chloroflexota bacterium]
MTSRIKHHMEEERQDKTIEQVAVFAALADSTRLRLLKLLCHQTPPGCRCVNALAALLGVTQSAISQHLRVLRSVGLVKGWRRGYRIHYLINREALAHCQSLLSSALEMPETDEDTCGSHHRPTREARRIS